MKIAYLVLAHNNPQLLKRAIATLTCEDSSFFLHIDKKSRIEEFSGIAGDNVFFCRERIAVYWGEYSQVEAILELIREALEHPNGYDYLVLISGSDYPLRSGKYIRDFLVASDGGEFISLVKIPCPNAGKPLARINTVRYPSDQPLRRFSSRVLAKFGLAQRDYREYLGELQPYSGSTWWALTREVCQYMMDFANTHKQFEDFFRTTPAPDEMFLHTILGNSPYVPRFRRNFHFVDWPPQGGRHPAMINLNHIKTFEAQKRIVLQDVYGTGEALFARKFSDDHLDLVQRIDDMIVRVESN